MMRFILIIIFFVFSYQASSSNPFHPENVSSEEGFIYPEEYSFVFKDTIPRKKNASASINFAQTQTDERKVTFYPNPVTGNQFTVKANENIKTIEVINLIGQAVLKHENKNVNGEVVVYYDNIDRGMYLVKVTFSDNGVIVKKILVK